MRTTGGQWVSDWSVVIAVWALFGLRNGNQNPFICFCISYIYLHLDLFDKVKGTGYIDEFIQVDLNRV